MLWFGSVGMSSGAMYMVVANNVRHGSYEPASVLKIVGPCKVGIRV